MVVQTPSGPRRIAKPLEPTARMMLGPDCELARKPDTPYNTVPAGIVLAGTNSAVHVAPGRREERLYTQPESPTAHTVEREGVGKPNGSPVLPEPVITHMLLTVQPNGVGSTLQLTLSMFNTAQWPESPQVRAAAPTDTTDRSATVFGSGEMGYTGIAPLGMRGYAVESMN